jgi:hypothetical protein
MGTNGGAVDHLDVTIMRGAHGVDQSVPYAGLPPSQKAVVTSGARSVALWKVAPWRSRSKHPKNAIQDAPIIDAGHTSQLVGQQRLNRAPFKVGQVISAHIELESEFGAI